MFNDCLILKISFNDCILKVKRLSNAIFEIKWLLNKKMSFNICIIPYHSMNLVYFHLVREKSCRIGMRLEQDEKKNISASLSWAEQKGWKFSLDHAWIEYNNEYSLELLSRIGLILLLWSFSIEIWIRCLWAFVMIFDQMTWKWTGNGLIYFIVDPTCM